jgi:hypothetical protein
MLDHFQIIFTSKRFSFWYSTCTGFRSPFVLLVAGTCWKSECTLFFSSFIDIKEQIQSIMTQNTQNNKNDEFVDDYIDKRNTRHPNHFEHNAPLFTETEKQLEEADLQQILLSQYNISNDV